MINGMPHHEGVNYILSVVVGNAKKVDHTSDGHIIITTEPINGVVYRSMFAQAGESMNGRVVVCTMCKPVYD